MFNKRKSAIIGIIFPIIGLFPMLTTRDPDTGLFVQIIQMPGAFPYSEVLLQQIWIQLLTMFCILIICFIYYYAVFLINGIKNRAKTELVLSIMGIIMTLIIPVFLHPERINDGVYYYFLLVLFAIVFSIIMFIRSFMKVNI